ncbi:hypothetical protein GCM10009557_35770 [Virgisporangium ochraceum]|uniref:WD40 repeat domain-containing protein n=1 Tax=Virgisporangium ochraceum TaxID=65505 RepID=A0A8J3ZV91_9ACTN|nr:hypothetical protein [Virgisporangium ochraceum]GIJ70817.1 hypothetical protein Voc01_057340 [Virgisporangium ochraceum]
MPASEAQLRPADDNVESVAWSPDGVLLASCGYAAVRIWDVRAGSDDEALRLWDATTGDLLATLLRLDDDGAAVLVDGRPPQLTGTPDGEFWHVVDGRRIEPRER